MVAIVAACRSAHISNNVGEQNYLFLINCYFCTPPPTSPKDVSLLSSDLSIELSHNEEQLPTLIPEEDGKSDADDEELPSFLMQVDKSK